MAAAERGKRTKAAASELPSVAMFVDDAAADAAPGAAAATEPPRDVRPPWAKAARKPASGQKLSPELRAKAAARAAAAGRRYPNLIDNMWAASRQKAAPDEADDV